MSLQRDIAEMEIFYRLMSGLHIASRNCSKPMELLAELFVETLQIEPLTGDRSHVIRQELLHSHEVAGRTLHDASQVQGAPQLCHTSVGSHLPFPSQKCTYNYRKKQKSRGNLKQKPRENLLNPGKNKRPGKTRDLEKQETWKNKRPRGKKEP